MENESILTGTLLIWQGIKMTAKCAVVSMVKSFIKACKDTVRGIVHHPIEALLIISVIAFQFVTIAKQRVERDQSSRKEYLLEQSLDSAKIISEIMQYRNENEKIIK